MPSFSCQLCQVEWPGGQSDCTVHLTLKGIQWLKINFFIEFTNSILGMNVFVKTDFDIMLSLSLSVYDYENKTSGSVKNPSWL